MSKSPRITLTMPQPKLGAIGLISLLGVGELVTPMSLDMYTPAIPHMTENFDTSESMVTLTLTGYYLFFAVGMLLFGPLSDKYGRKGPLLLGAAMYVAGGVLCALSSTIELLIASRIVQALGAGAIAAICMAIIKDCFESRQRERILAIVQILVAIGPVIAPIIGALIVENLHWRVTFWVLATIGLMLLLISFLLHETLPKSERSPISVGKTISRLAVVAKNPGFTIWLLIIGASEIPFMGYITVGSYIYMDYYGTTELGYSLLFAAASITMAVGALMWLPLSKVFKPKTFTTIALVLCIIIGVMTATVGQMGVGWFCACIVLFALVMAIPKPYFANIALEQHEGDTGSTSALLNFGRTFIGVLGMVLVVMWPNYIVGVGMLMAVCMGAAFVLWVFLLRSHVKLVRIKDDKPTGLL